MDKFMDIGLSYRKGQQLRNLYFKEGSPLILSRAQGRLFKGTVLMLVCRWQLSTNSWLGFLQILRKKSSLFSRFPLS